ncbi:MAG: GHMP kinase [Nitrospinae bacterium]|nr:GHMP kinase [Nitrospinota bacterium]
MERLKHIEVIAPLRGDLAGGTLDIWPLYLLLERPSTINVALSIYAKVKIDIRKDKKIVVVSKDRGKGISFGSISEIHHRHILPLVTRITAFFNPTMGLTIETDSEAPAGSGLGGSSALNIALCYALNLVTEKGYKKKELQVIARNIEARVLGVPAGEQDYFPPLYGSLSNIALNIDGVERRGFKGAKLKELEERLIIAYSGESRNSGINNWEVYKGVIEGNKKLLTNLNALARISEEVGRAIKDNDFDQLGKLIQREWKKRKSLWGGISTPKIEEIIAYSLSNGAMSAKVCGAGGGGCILIYAAKGKKKALADKLQEQGVRLLNSSIDKKGVRIIDRLE